jgi:hypothetical protein
LGPLAPVLRAQDDADGATRETYVGEVRDRLANKEGLEQLYQRAAQRHQTLTTELNNLRSQPMPPGWTSQQLQARDAELASEVKRNQSILQRTQGKLTNLYERIKQDRERVEQSKDALLQQQLGVLVGVGGNQAVPIWNRMTAKDLGGMVKYGAENAHLATVDFRAPRYRNIATNAGARAANAEAALGSLPSVEWVPEPHPTGPNMRLVPRDAATGEVIAGWKPQETSIPSKITNGNGQVVDNPNAMASGRDLAQLYNTRTQIGNELRAVKYKASQAINEAQRGFFDRHATNLEAKKAALEADIAKYQSENPSMGSRASALVKDAGKWAAMSVGMNLGANVISQLSENGWDPYKLNWRKATDFLVDPKFWGGTAGSFVGGLAGSALASALPGGVFVKTALSIGGAAAGWQVGSGNLNQTDWLGLGVTTLGATAGYLAGMAAFGPIGGIIGGMAGQYLSQMLYDQLRKLLHDPESESKPREQYPAEPPSPNKKNPDGYAVPPSPPKPVVLTQDSGGGATDAAGLSVRVREAYNLYLASAQNGDQAAAAQHLQEYQELRRQLGAMRAGAGPADYRESH